MSNYLALLNILGEYEKITMSCHKGLKSLKEDPSVDSRILKAEILLVLASAYIHQGGDQNRDTGLAYIKESKATFDTVIMDNRSSMYWRKDDWQRNFKIKMESSCRSFVSIVPIEFVDKLSPLFMDLESARQSFPGIEPQGKTLSVLIKENPGFIQQINSCPRIFIQVKLWLSNRRTLKQLRNQLWYYVAQSEFYGISYALWEIGRFYSSSTGNTGLKSKPTRLLSFKKSKDALLESLYYAEKNKMTDRAIRTYAELASLYRLASQVTPQKEKYNYLYNQSVGYLSKAVDKIEDTARDLPSLYHYAIDRAYFLENMKDIFYSYYCALVTQGYFWKALQAIERIKAKNLFELAGLGEEFYNNTELQISLGERLNELKEKDQNLRLDWISWFQQMVHEAHCLHKQTKNSLSNYINPEVLSNAIDGQTAIVQFVILPRHQTEILIVVPFSHLNEHQKSCFQKTKWQFDKELNSKNKFIFSRHSFGENDIYGNFDKLHDFVDRLGKMSEKSKEDRFQEVEFNLEELSQEWEDILNDFEIELSGTSQKFQDISDVKDDFLRPVTSAPKTDKFKQWNEHLLLLALPGIICFCKFNYILSYANF